MEILIAGMNYCVPFKNAIMPSSYNKEFLIFHNAPLSFDTDLKNVFSVTIPYVIKLFIMGLYRLSINLI